MLLHTGDRFRLGAFPYVSSLLFRIYLYSAAILSARITLDLVIRSKLQAEPWRISFE